MNNKRIKRYFSNGSLKPGEWRFWQENGKFNFFWRINKFKKILLSSNKEECLKKDISKLREKLEYFQDKFPVEFAEWEEDESNELDLDLTLTKTRKNKIKEGFREAREAAQARKKGGEELKRKVELMELFQTIKFVVVMSIGMIMTILVSPHFLMVSLYVCLYIIVDT
jgi:hypothetical protein